MFILKKLSAKMQKNTAFSLVELLMALLVASLLMAALAPVMTKKFGENILVSGMGNTLIPKAYCAYINNGSSPIIKDTKDEGCIIPDNTYNASIIMASGGGGGGGAAQAAYGTTDYTLIPAYTGGNGAAVTGGGSTQNIKFSKESHTMWIYLTGGGAGGGGGNGKIIMTPDEESCKMIGSKGTDTDGHTDWATYDGFGLCVTKFNQAGNSKCASEQASTCTASHSEQLYSYSGCNRKACTIEGARQACADLSTKTGQKWKLPSGDEGLKWVNNLPLWRKIGLCDRNTANALVRCTCGKNVVSSHGSCTHEFWSNDANDTNPTKRFSFIYTGSDAYSGGLVLTAKNDYANIGNRAHSTRCVLPETYKYFTGGGGGSGVFVKLKVPQNVLTKATEKGDATLKTFAGNGGKGGAGKNKSGGIAGTASYAEIFDTDNNTVWKITVPGAQSGGSGADEILEGKGGYSGSVNQCKYLDTTDPKYSTEQTINCADLPNAIFGAGENGGDGAIGTSYASSGYGARAAWGDGTLQSSRIYPPSGESSDLINGLDATIAGSGGSGGNCNYTNGILTCGQGGNGAGGKIYATHRVSFPGAGGGGGAAGTVAHIKNIQVRPGDFFRIQAGHGGNGGNIGMKGMDGGNSYVELTRETTKISKYEILGGGGGEGAIKGNPDTNTQPIPGSAGNESKIASGIHIPNNEYYPKKAYDTKGSDGIISPDFVSAYGGNGGINSAISHLASTDGTMNGKPCGGLNTNEIKIDDKIKWECNSNSIIPLNLTRALNDSAITSNDINEIIQNLAPGGTGGGGGGWQNGADPESSGGAKGMGGYVIIYFGDWSESE